MGNSDINSILQISGFKYISKSRYAFQTYYSYGICSTSKFFQSIFLQIHLSSCSKYSYQFPCRLASNCTWHRCTRNRYDVARRYIILVTYLSVVMGCLLRQWSIEWSGLGTRKSPCVRRKIEGVIWHVSVDTTMNGLAF